jgi:hypothetical protein
LLEVGFNMMIILFRTRGRVIQAEKKWNNREKVFIWITMLKDEFTILKY